jgi:hypothetical protein
MRLVAASPGGYLGRMLSPLRARFCDDPNRPGPGARTPARHARPLNPSAAMSHQADHACLDCLYASAIGSQPGG